MDNVWTELNSHGLGATPSLLNTVPQDKLFFIFPREARKNTLFAERQPTVV